MASNLKILTIFTILSSTRSQVSISTQKEKFPFLGHLICGEDNNITCLGILVSPMFILTTVQCFQSGCTQVRLLNDKTIYKPQEIFFPVDYEEYKRKNVTLFDVGLIKITPNVELSEKVHVAKIAEQIYSLNDCITVWWNENMLKIYSLSPKYGQFLECNDDSPKERCKTIRTFRPKSDALNINLCEHRHKALPLICSNILTGILYTQKCFPEEVEANDKLMDIEWKLIATAQKIITRVRDLELRRHQNTEGSFRNGIGTYTNPVITLPYTTRPSAETYTPYPDETTTTTKTTTTTTTETTTKQVFVSFPIMQPEKNLQTTNMIVATEIRHLMTASEVELQSFPDVDGDDIDDPLNENLADECITHIKWGGSNKRIKGLDFRTEPSSSNFLPPNNFYIFILLLAHCF